MPTLKPPSEIQVIKLPKPLQDYLDFQIHEGDRNEALKNAAMQARDCRWSLEETMARLLPLAVERDGYPESGARATIKSMYSREARDVPHGTFTGSASAFASGTPFRKAPKAKEMPAAEYEFDEHFKLPDPMESPVIAILEALYKPGERVLFMGAEFNSDMDTKDHPDRDDINILERDGLLKILREKTGGNIGMLDVFDSKRGLYFNLNPVSKTATSRKKEDIQDYRYGLIEFDHIPVEQQFQLLTKSGLPIAAMTHSGRNSIHAIVKINAGRDEHLFKARMNAIIQHFRKYDVDPKNNDITRLSRFPGVTRADSKGAQTLLSLEVGLSTYEEWERTMVVEEDGLPAIEDMADLIAQVESGKLIEPAEVIVGVAHKGCKLGISASSKAKKTWVLADLAACVLSGSKLFDRLKCNKGKVLYINMELPKFFMTKRIIMILEKKGFKLEKGNFKVLNLRGFAAHLAMLRPKIEAAIASDQFDLIILDPTYKLMPGGDENGTGDTSTLLNEMEKLAVNSGALIAFASHFSKGNQSTKSAIDRTSGSGVFGRDPDTIIVMTEHQQVDALTVDLILRNHRPVESFVVKWESPTFVVDTELDPIALAETPKTKKTGVTGSFFKIDLDEKYLIQLEKWCSETLQRDQSQNKILIEIARIWSLDKEPKAVKEKLLPALLTKGILQEHDSGLKRGSHTTKFYTFHREVGVVGV
jgi:RecA-family ATPase